VPKELFVVDILPVPKTLFFLANLKYILNFEPVSPVGLAVGQFDIVFKHFVSLAVLV